MCIKTHTKDEKRRLLPNLSKLAIALMIVSCLIGSAVAAGEPDPKPTAVDDKTNTGIWDIFDKKEILQSAKDAWDDGLADAGGNMLIGIAVVIAFFSILVVLFLGIAVTNLGKLGSDNDTHARGKAMVGSAIATSIMIALGLCIIVMALSGWL